jgi:hypothetical protein
MGHAWRLPPSGTAGDAVEGLSTAVADQRTLEANVYQKTVDHQDEWANRHHVKLASDGVDSEGTYRLAFMT